jgi:hypothetical protein
VKRTIFTLLALLLVAALATVVTYVRDEKESTTIQSAIAFLDQGNGLKAVEILEPLAERGNDMAVVLTALIYAEGNGIPRDDQKALSWLRKRAHLFPNCKSTDLAAPSAHELAIEFRSRKKEELAKTWDQLAIAGGYVPGSCDLSKK